MAGDISPLLVWAGPRREGLAGRVDVRVVQSGRDETMMLLLAALFVAAALGLRLFLAVAPSLGLVDHPNARSLHAVPTAVGGGAVPMALLSLVIVLLSQLPYAGWIGFVMMSLVAIGLLDDWRGIPSSIRLLWYVGASVVLAASLPSVQLGGAVGFFALSLAIAWCINLVNFMDGIDGLVVVQALCLAVGVGIIGAVRLTSADTGPLVLLCSALVACWAPLLWFNWPPAKLFMGDAGAVPLGFFIALLGLLAVTLDTVMGWVWLVLMMPFLIDTSVTLCLRVAAGHAPHVAHRDHAYQRLALRAGNPLPVTLGLLALQAVWQFPLAVTVSTETLFPPLVVLLSTIPALLLVVYARRKA